jgi:hypothetical protein
MEVFSMAQQVNVMLVDDLDGSVAEETVAFGLDGRTYEVDLSTGNATQLRDAMAGFVAVARRGDGRSRRRPVADGQRSNSDRERTATVRQWARSNGHEVSDRGRISRSVMAAHENRDTSSPASVPAAKKKSRKR